ncbi:hypothetical protein Ahy_B04g073016 [Arachis hypogaea]|uniref:Uncharacterized protein n=1 Tax=Arachis hypogaea TaxID=3818 RepID=A0A444ZPA0_ARAHY|nr:hypothetical protein Ahy_B04g073016 [Arachis hypogaea]
MKVISYQYDNAKICSARLHLPGPEQKGIINSGNNVTDQNPTESITQLDLPLLENANQGAEILQTENKIGFSNKQKRACYTYKFTSLQVGPAQIQLTHMKRDYMERHIHALNTQTVTYPTIQNIQIVANLRNLHQNTIKLSIKNLKRKQSNNTQARNQTKDLKCATHLLSDKFRNMSEEKKAIVRDLGFGGLMHIPALRVDHQLLRELANNFKLGENRLKTGYGSFKITPKTIGDALGINATETGGGGHVLTFMVKGITDYKEKKKKAIDGYLFALMIIYFHLSKNKGKKRAERPPKPWIANWTKEQLVERMTAEREEILTETTTDSDTSTSESETQEDSEDSGRKHPSKKGKKMDSRKRKKSQEESDSDSESESESSDESEESSPVEKEKKKKKTKTTPKKTQPKKKKVVVEDSPPEEDQYFDGERYEISSDELDEWLRENVDKSAAEGENQADLRSTEGRYVSSETIPAVNLESDDPSSQGRTEQSSVNQPSESMLSLADSNMMVVREQTPSDALAIVPIQVFVLASQTTTETDFEPTPMLQIEGTTETTPEPPQTTSRDHTHASPSSN